MKFIYLLPFLMLAFFNISKAQQFNLDQYNKERLGITKKGMVVLGSWGVGSMVWGGVGWASSKTDGSHKYFHQMNFAWGAINGILAGLSFIGRNKEGQPLSLAASVKAQRGMEKLYLINAGLDVLYIGSGAYIWERSKRAGTKNPERLEGFGQSIVLQGGFLLLFDGIMYAIHNKHGKLLFKQLDNVQLAAGPTQISLVVKL